MLGLSTQHPSRSSSPSWRQGLIVGLSGLLLCATSTLHAATLVQFKSPVSVASSVIRLGDIADIQDADPSLVTRLQSLSVAPAPSTGKTLQLDFDQIRQRILIQGISLGHLEFTGASVVTIQGGQTDDRRGSRPVNVSEVAVRRAEESVERAIAKYVTGVLPDVGQVSVQVRLTAEQTNHLATSGSGRLEISGGQLPLSEPQQMVVQFLDRLGQQQHLPVTAQVTPWPMVVVAKGNIARGSTIQPQEIELQQIDPATHQGTWIERLELVAGQETRRSLRGGEPVAIADLRALPLIRKGDLVTVYSRKGGVSVRLVAQAQGDGSLGQTVTLLVKNSKTPLLAKVSGYHEAEIAAPTTTTTEPRPSSNSSAKGVLSAGREGPHAHLRPSIPASLQPVFPAKSLSPPSASVTTPAHPGTDSARYMTPLFNTPQINAPQMSAPQTPTASSNRPVSVPRISP